MTELTREEEELLQTGAFLDAAAAGRILASDDEFDRAVERQSELGRIVTEQQIRRRVTHAIAEEDRRVTERLAAIGLVRAT